MFKTETFLDSKGGKFLCRESKKRSLKREADDGPRDNDKMLTGEDETLLGNFRVRVEIYLLRSEADTLRER